LEHGIDLGGHRAQPLTRELIDRADLVLAMGERHLTRVAELGGAGKAFLLTDFASNGERARGVADPFGGDLAAYRATFSELEARCAARWPASSRAARPARASARPPGSRASPGPTPRRHGRRGVGPVS
jgi:protein-tyrosine-phosphatase